MKSLFYSLMQTVRSIRFALSLILGQRRYCSILIFILVDLLMLFIMLCAVFCGALPRYPSRNAVPALCQRGVHPLWNPFIMFVRLMFQVWRSSFRHIHGIHGGDIRECWFFRPFLSDSRQYWNSGRKYVQDW